MADQHGQLTAGLVDKEEVAATNPVKIQDLTLRDGHQSIFATRMRTEDMIPIAEEMDKVGFYSVGVWGGATFDVMHRFLAEDPWERPRTLKKYFKNTPLQMLLRGQNLVAYRNHPDDLTEAFVERAVINGIDIFRVFDAVNDLRNFQTAVKVIKKMGKEFEGALCYSLTEPRMGGPVYNVDYYVAKAKQLEDMGADVVCIKDMAGLISPYDAYMLVKALKEAVTVPIHLHSHFTSGQSGMALLKAIEAGVDIIDTCMAPWAYRTSHPALEPLVVTLRGTDRDPGFDLERLVKIDEYLEKIAPKYRHLLDDTKLSIIDVGVLLHQTPGGMLSNLVNQLREMNALDRIDDVFKELPRVRKEMGQVPLVTPTSQVVGIQTVNNVLFDTPEERYKMTTAQTKDLFYGLYGETPAPLDTEVQQKALKGYPRGEEPITCRPADILDPELDKARATAGDLAKDIDDVLIVALYPTTGLRFLKWKYGLTELPDEVKPKTLEQVKEEERLVALARAGKLVEKVEKPAPEKGPGIRTYNVFVDDEYFEVEVEEVGGTPTVTSVTPMTPQAARAPAAPAPAPSTPPPEPAKPAAAPRVEGATPIEAPMPGMIIRYEVQEGDTVKEGDVLLILEAMKMENSITTTVAGTVVSIPFKSGDSVQKGDVLAAIG
jgi:pyruvate carboxylase subunit B